MIAAQHLSRRLAGFILTAALVATAAPVSGPVWAQGAPGKGGPKEVGVITTTREEVPRVYTLPGRAVAFEQTDIRPRISGVITEILYEPGKPIAAGAPMFRLDDVTARADLRAAEAAVASARAQVTVKRNALDRSQQLVGKGVTQADLESARADYEQAAADLQGAEAELEVAQTQLSWTTVRSPIAGVAGLAKVSVGDLVTASQADALARVTRLDPIEVDMFEPSARMLAIRDEIESGTLRAADTMNLTLTLENGVTYAATGSLVASGSEVSTTTGTVDYRFRVANPEGRILPGMFLRGEAQVGTTEGVLVPQLAASRDAQGRLAVMIVEDGKAARRPISAQATRNNAWIVTDGLQGGEQLIVEGLTNLRPGAEVKPVAVTIDAQGVIRPAAQE